MLKSILHGMAATLLVLPLAASAIEPGEYISERSAGTLEVKREKSGKLAFNLDSVGANAHTCTLEGEIKGGKATLEADDPKRPCIVTFTYGKDGVRVSGGPDSVCQYFCGMRATFEGLYMKAPAACRVDTVDKTRATARKAYDRKAYEEARGLLAGALKNCSFFLGWTTEGWVRNDLAVTQHKLKDLAGCRETLKPLAEDAAMTDAQLRENYPPTDADIYLPVIKAARVNLKLCAAAKP